MSLGNVLAKYRGIVLIVCAVVLIVCVSLSIQHFGAVSNMRESVLNAKMMVYYYDVNTGKPFVAAQSDVVPVKAPSDQTGALSGVRAHYYSCGKCEDKASQFLGYFEKLSPEAIGFVAKGEHAEMFGTERLLADKGWLVATDPKATDWVERGSDEGAAIIAGVDSHCNAPDTSSECSP